MEKNEIIAIYGTKIKEMTTNLMEGVDFPSLLPDKDARIALKPNLVVATTPDTGATTHTEIVCAIIEFLQSHGYKHIKIVESAWVGDSTRRGFEVNGYDTISRRYQVPLVDVKGDSYTKKSAEGITMEISNEILNTDFLISLPVLKGHCQTYMTCALKNMKGCLSDRSKRAFHTLGLHKPIAALNEIRHADLVIVDSISGDLDFEEGGNPVETDRLFAARDSVLMDSYGASLMGFALEEIPYITLASKFGVGSADLSKLRLTQLNEPNTSTLGKSMRRIQGLEKYTDQKDACSACYGALIHALKRMSDSGQLRRLGNTKIAIGQGFKGCTDEKRIGVGNCTRGLGKSVHGCPARASDIIDLLSEEF